MGQAAGQEVLGDCSFPKEVEAEKSGSDSQLQHTSALQVDGLLLRFLVGKGGEVKAKLERETGAVIDIPFKPKTKFGSTTVGVRGASKESVESAMQKMQSILNEAVESPNFQYTHFISLPLARPALIEKLTAFRHAVLATVDNGNDDEEEQDPTSADVAGAPADVDNSPASDSTATTSAARGSSKKARSWHGIEESVFIKPATFHLTVLMLKLWSQDRIQRAADVLQSTLPAVHEALEGRPLVIQLNGIKNMRGNPAKAHVLYADVIEKEGGDRLQRACNILREAFFQSGLVLEKDCREKLLLHATLINTSSRKAHKGKFRRIPLDARQILADHGETEWGDFEIEEAHLSQRFLYHTTGYYHCCSSIPFPLSGSS